MGAKGEYNDNILLTNLSHEPVYGVWLSPGTRFKYRTELLEVEGNAAADFVKYFGQGGLDITNFYFPVTARYRTEKDRLLIDGAYIRDNTLVGELQQTGVVNQRTQRNWWNAHPQWKHSLSDRLAVNTEYQYTKASYQNGVQFNLFDYTTNLGSVGLEYQATERDTVTLTGYYLAFQADVVNLDADYYGLQLGLGHDFTDTLRVDLSGGFRNIKSTQTFSGVGTSSTDFVWVFNASLQKRFERTAASIGFSREINPSGVGLLLQTDHLSLSVRHELTQTMYASVTGDVYWISPTTAAVIPNSRYYFVQPRLHYRLSEWWTAELSYRHAQVDIDVVNTTATQNAVYLAVTYRIPKLAWSW